MGMGEEDDREERKVEWERGKCGKGIKDRWNGIEGIMKGEGKMKGDRGKNERG